MAQQRRQAVHDGKPETEAAAVLARRIVELVEFLKNLGYLAFGDTPAGVPYLEKKRIAAITERLAACRSPPATTPSNGTA